MIIVQSDLIHIHGAANSMQGGRPENQDDFAFLDTPVGFLAIVCDGMGGGPGGKTASYIAKCEIARAICSCAVQTPCEHALKMAVSIANDAIEAKMKEVPSLQGMGSTFVAVLVNKQAAYVAHAGDSRCYLLRKGKCVYRSQDHSLVAELVKKKALTEEEARLSPQSNVISRGLGSTTNHVPEIEEIPYKKGDRIVLCTDGVWGTMPNKDLLNRFSQKTDIQHLVANISSEIDNIGFSKGGHHDNHTLVIFDIELNSNLKKPVNWKLIAIVGSVTLVVIAVIISLIVYLKDNNSNPIGCVQVNSSNVANNQPQGYPGADVRSVSSQTTPSKAISDSLKSVVDSLTNAQKQENDSAKSKGEKTHEKPDSSSRKQQQQETKANTPHDLVQQIIQEYMRAINAEGDSEHDTQLKLDKCKENIIRMLSGLYKLCSSQEVKNEISKIGNKHKNNPWFTDRRDTDTGKFKPTHATSDSCKAQINYLEDLKKKI